MLRLLSEAKNLGLFQANSIWETSGHILNSLIFHWLTIISWRCSAFVSEIEVAEWQNSEGCHQQHRV